MTKSIMLMLLMNITAFAGIFPDTDLTDEERKVIYSSPIQNYPTHPECFNVFVWNIYKGEEDNLYDELARLTKDMDYVLIQEALFNNDTQFYFEQFVNSIWYGVRTFWTDGDEEATGVMTGSSWPSHETFRYVSRQTEPIVGTPKSAMITTTILPNNQLLKIVNVHAINFVFMGKFKKFFRELLPQLINHDGPMIFAGDFNTWSEDRWEFIYDYMESLNLVEAEFSPDDREYFVKKKKKKVKILDTIFYRGLDLVMADSRENDASDHNPMRSRFCIQK